MIKFILFPHILPVAKIMPYFALVPSRTVNLIYNLFVFLWNSSCLSFSLSKRVHTFLLSLRSFFLIIQFRWSQSEPLFSRRPSSVIALISCSNKENCFLEHVLHCYTGISFSCILGSYFHSQCMDPPFMALFMNCWHSPSPSFLELCLANNVMSLTCLLSLNLVVWVMFENLGFK